MAASSHIGKLRAPVSVTVNIHLLYSQQEKQDVGVIKKNYIPLEWCKHFRFYENKSISGFNFIFSLSAYGSLTVHNNKVMIT